MPLSYGLLHTLPVLMSWQDARDQLLPLWGALLLSVGWLNRSSRGALISELTSWVLAVPLSLTVLQEGWRLLLRRSTRGFRITPKHQRRDRGSCSAALVLPLVALTVISLINLQGLLMPTAQTTPGDQWSPDWSALGERESDQPADCPTGLLGSTGVRSCPLATTRLPRLAQQHQRLLSLLHDHRDE